MSSGSTDIKIKKSLFGESLMTNKFFSMLLSGSLTMIVSTMLMMSDSLIAGTMIGKDAVEGITLITPFVSFTIFIGSLFSMGVPIIYSSARGRFDRKEGDEAFGTGILLTMIAGVLVLLFAVFLGDFYIDSFNASEEASEMAKGYLKWIRMGLLIMPFQYLLFAMVFCEGDEIVTTAANITECVGNITFSIILGRVMGIEGIGLASFIFTSTATALLFLHLLRKKNTLRLNIYFSLRHFKHVMKLSIIDASSYLFISLLSTFTNFFLITYYGKKYLILASVIAISRDIVLIFDGIGESMTPILSVYIAEDCFAGVRRIYRLAEKTAIIEGIIVTILIMLIAPFLVGLIGIDDPEIRSVAIFGLRMISLSMVCTSLLYLVSSYYLLIERIGLGFFICLFRDIAVCVPLSFILGVKFGIEGLMGAFAAAPFLAFFITCLTVYLRFGKDDIPLLIKSLEKGKESYIFDIVLEKEVIVKARDEVETIIKEKGISKMVINRVMVLFEDLLMIIAEYNEGSKVIGEFSVVIDGDRIRITERDTGKKLDLADPDIDVTSLRRYVVSQLAEKVSNSKQHLVAMSFNRNVFEL